MSTRKRSKSNANQSDAEMSDTPKRRTRATAGKARATPRKKLADEPDFKRSDSEGEVPVRKVEKEEIHYEFGGPIGALGVILGTPFVMYMLFFLCNNSMCLSNPLNFDWSKFVAQIKFENFFSNEASIMYLGWLAFNVLLERILPGETVEGTVLPNSNGKRLKYTMSGHLQFWVCLLAVTHGYPLLVGSGTDGATASWWAETYQLQGLMPLRLELIYDHYLQLISISLVSTALFSLWL